MPGPFPVRPRPEAPPATRALLVGVIRATGASAAHRATVPPPVALPRWSPYRLPGRLTRRVVGRLDRLVVERFGRWHDAAPSRRR